MIFIKVLIFVFILRLENVQGFFGKINAAVEQHAYMPKTYHREPNSERYKNSDHGTDEGITMGIVAQRKAMLNAQANAKKVPEYPEKQSVASLRSRFEKPETLEPERVRKGPFVMPVKKYNGPNYDEVRTKGVAKPLDRSYYRNTPSQQIDQVQAQEQSKRDPNPIKMHVPPYIGQDFQRAKEYGESKASLWGRGEPSQMVGQGQEQSKKVAIKMNIPSYTGQDFQRAKEYGESKASLWGRDEPAQNVDQNQPKKEARVMEIPPYKGTNYQRVNELGESEASLWGRGQPIGPSSQMVGDKNDQLPRKKPVVMPVRAYTETDFQRAKEFGENEANRKNQPKRKLSKTIPATREVIMEVPESNIDYRLQGKVPAESQTWEPASHHLNRIQPN